MWESISLERRTAAQNRLKYPGVDLAYEIAVESYDSVVKRIDVMDGRIQTLLAFAATTTAVVPTVAKSIGLSFASRWLYLALITFTLQLLVGLVGRSVGQIRLLEPELFYQRWLHKDSWRFKKDLIYFAGLDFKKNAALLKTRWWFTVLISILFVIEALLLVGWVAFAH